MHSQQRNKNKNVDSGEANASSGEETRKRRQGAKPSYSDEERSQGSNSSGTLKKISLRARRRKSANGRRDLASSQESDD
jgi:hypothetical protein